MFSRKDQLLQRTGEYGVGRYEFLRQLIQEFTTTTSYECKKQTLANLANFTYDPINYEFIKQLHLIDLFLAELSNDNEELIHFALAGLCNIVCDPESREYIISLNGVKLISSFLLHKNEEISLNALTTLFYIYESKNTVVSQELEQTIFQMNTTRILLRNYSILLSKFVAGDEVKVTRIITKEDIDNFSKLSGDTNPIHSSECNEKPFVHGAFLNSMVSGVIGTKLPGPGSVVVQQTLNFPNKCYVGETITIRVKVIDKRKIIKVDFSCDVESSDRTVMYGNAKLIMKTYKI
ncbi:hypothetical protein JTB14_024426 [Gonioctena quinquepunctata]|nr:hypothetical protein JTB14_024426 [Gonioctena quinquepunctata]